MKRTLAIKLQTSQEAEILFEDLQLLFSTACSEISQVAFKEKEKNRVRLHHLCYKDVRNKYPSLGSQMVCNAIAKVSSSYKAGKSRPVKPIRFRQSSSVHFDKRTYSVKGTTLSVVYP